MQGLLDIWNNYWDKPQHTGASTTFDDEWRKKKLLRGEDRSNLSTAGGVDEQVSTTDGPKRKYKRGEIPPTDPK